MQGVIYALTRQAKNVSTYDIEAAKTGSKTCCKNNEKVCAESLRGGGGAKPAAISPYYSFFTFFLPSLAESIASITLSVDFVRTVI